MQQATTAGGPSDSEDEEDNDDNKQEDPHCDVNFVKNTVYKLRSDNINKIWAEGSCIDPAPKIPSSRSKQLKSGDYLLMKGSDITLKEGKGTMAIVFHPEEEYILCADWTQFGDAMTGRDMVDLEDVTFLLWWQNIVPPKEPKAKPTAAAKKAAAAKKSKGRKR